MKIYLSKLLRITMMLMAVTCFSSTQGKAQIHSNYKPFYDEYYKPESQLRLLLSKTKADTSRVKYFVALADSFTDRPDALKADMDSAEHYLKKAYALADFLGSAKWKHNTLMQYGQLYAEMRMPDKQKAIYETAISLAKKLGDREMEADSWFYYYNNTLYSKDISGLKEAVQRAEKALTIYKQTGQIAEEIFTLKGIADLHLQMGKFNEAEKEMLRVISHYKSINYKDICFSYDLLSAVYNHKGDLSKALYYALSTIKSYKGNDINYLGTFSIRIAEAYAAIGKRNDSIEWYNKAYRYYYNSNYISVPVLEMTTQLVYNGEAKKALAIIETTDKRLKNKSDLDQFCLDLAYGETYTALGKYKTAAPYFETLLKRTVRDTAANEINTLIFFHIGEFYFAQQKNDEASYYLNKSIKNKAFITLPMQIRLNKTLFDIDMAENDPDHAIIHLQAFHKLQDSIFSQEKLNTIERLQIEFKAAQKENENEILRKKSQLQAQELDRAQLIKKTTFGGIGFLSIVIVLLYNRFNLKQRVNNILIKQKKAIDVAYSKLEVSVLQKNKLIDDKECLIKEVHHRVKNNLQLTMSLLNSQSYYLEDTAAIAAIRESQHRLKSIALIHQKLYQTENVATININPYVAELVDYLRESLSDGKRISFELDMLDLEMDISQAVPLGLFLNEAITNIFKYAFPAASKGNVKISLHGYKDEKYILQIKDNGVGLPDGLDYLESKTLGMTLMKGLSAQIDGELIILNDNGLSISLIFENTELSITSNA